MGAGILPIALYKNKLLFLFGKERSSGLWSDFGGGAEKNETEIQTAIREGGEELNGLLGIGDELFKKVKDNMLNILPYEEYTIYIFKIPYDANLPTYFNNSNSFATRYLPKQLNRSGLFEKKEMRWFSIDDMKAEKKTFRPFYRGVVNILIREYKTLLANARVM
jgi:8-oxo-dGTP pyrophosphatase MutT (NUDIX family)